MAGLLLNCWTIFGTMVASDYKKAKKLSVHSRDRLGAHIPHTCTLSTHLDVMASILVLVIPGGFRACSDCRSVPKSSIAAMIRVFAPDQRRCKRKKIVVLGAVRKGVMREGESGVWQTRRFVPTYSTFLSCAKPKQNCLGGTECGKQASSWPRKCSSCGWLS